MTGVILLFFVASCLPLSQARPFNFDKKQYSSSHENITVTFTYPENGIYWNDRKMMPSSVPLILHGNGAFKFQGFRLCRDTPVDYAITGPVMMVEFYLDDVLVGNVTTLPFEFHFDVLMTSFSQVSLKIIAYGGNQHGVGEITIYRLFV